MVAFLLLTLSVMAEVAMSGRTYRKRTDWFNWDQSANGTWKIACQMLRRYVFALRERGVRKKRGREMKK